MGRMRKAALVGCLIIAGAAALGAWIERPLTAAVIAGGLAYLVVEFAAWASAKRFGTSGPQP